MASAVRDEARSRGAGVALLRLGVCAALAAACALSTSAVAQSIWDDPAFARYREAAAALEAREYPRASALAREAIAAYPGHALAHYLLGQAALAQSRWDDAATALQRVVALYPRSAAARRDLGVAEQQQGRVDEAARAYEAALDIRPDDEETRARLAFMLANAGQGARAQPHLAALADRGSARPQVYLALAKLAYDRGDLPASASAFEKALALEDSGRSWFNLGVVRVRMGQTAAALEAFERAARHDDTREQAGKEIEKIKEGTRPARTSRPGLPR